MVRIGGSSKPSSVRIALFRILYQSRSLKSFLVAAASKTTVEPLSTVILTRNLISFLTTANGQKEICIDLQTTAKTKRSPFSINKGDLFQQMQTCPQYKTNKISATRSSLLQMEEEIKSWSTLMSK